MPTLNLKKTHKPVKTYYKDLAQKDQLHLLHEGNVAPVFADLLGHCAKKVGYTLHEQHPLRVPNTKRNLRLDGAILTSNNLLFGIWEAKDGDDDLDKEIKAKFERGYPDDNILFQEPNRAVLIQNGEVIMDSDISQPDALVLILQQFFAYENATIEDWESAVAQFKERVPEVARQLLDLIRNEYQRKNGAFRTAFDAFYDTTKNALNPNLRREAVEEMLVQHLLTERIFRKVFQSEDFTRRNAIAKQIETVVDALTQRALNRAQFFQTLEPFYASIEKTAATMRDYEQKQGFLNTVYEQFFQGYSVDVADTHGIVYTPQPIVSFMVRSVDEILKREWGRNLASDGVHILDPFVGTGNFIMRVMREIVDEYGKSNLPHKYAAELHCNELMLLPYYIASLNIEHAYYEAVGQYAPFGGICLVDTFELAEGQQMTLDLFSEENSARVKAQKEQDVFVVIGNPPYNIGQANENDNNKNRTYPVMDGRVADTYSADSTASNRNALSDPYVKAFRWAADRIGDEGVVAFVTNNGFLDNIAFDGMRQHLQRDFDALYLLDLGGNVRKNPKLSGTTHNVFGIQVGVVVSLLVKRGAGQRQGKIYYARLDEFWRKEQKYQWLEQHDRLGQVAWNELTPTAKHVWLTDGMQDDWDDLLPLGTKEGKRAKKGQAETLFKMYGRGLATSRDTWAYNPDRDALANNMQRMIATYNEQVFRYSRLPDKPRTQTERKKQVDDFVLYDDEKISWSRDLKQDLMRERMVEYTESNIRTSLYRPFSKKHVYFDSVMNEEVYQFPQIFPTPQTESENLVICVSGIGSNKPFQALISNTIPCLDSLEKTQCFPLYTYNEDGTGKTDNITDYGLQQFQAVAPHATREGVFYYVYAALHHPAYRDTYAANLKRDLPRIAPPATAEQYTAYERIGRALADLHLNYESAPRYPLTHEENPAAALDYRVEKMRFTGKHTATINPHPKSLPQNEGGTWNTDDEFPFPLHGGKGLGDGGDSASALHGGKGLGDGGDSPSALHGGKGLGDGGDSPSALHRGKGMGVQITAYTTLIYNDFLTLTGFPPQAFAYRLGNRSALEWIADQYRVKTDKRSGITSDPNNYSDNPQYIIELIERITHVSVETVKLINELATHA